MVSRFVESFSPPVVFGYASAATGFAMSVIAWDQMLGLVVKVLTIVTLALAISIQLRSLAKK